MPPQPIHRLIADARAAGSGNARLSSASEQGTSIALPTPCSTRAIASAGSVGAMPHSADAATKTASPAI